MREGTYHEGESKDLAYTAGFRDLMRQHPHGTKIFLELIRKLHSREIPTVGDQENKDGISIMVMQVRITDKGKLVPFYKLSVENKDFFVKERNGFSEFADTQRAKEKLSDIEWVEVLNPQIGYHNKNTNEGYFISEWFDLPVLEDCMKTTDESKKKELKEKMDILNNILGHSYYDTDPANAFFDESRNKIILFDLNELRNRVSPLED